MLPGVLQRSVVLLLLHHLQEIDALCDEWQPAPLVPDVSDEDVRPDPPVITRWGPLAAHSSLQQ